MISRRSFIAATASVAAMPSIAHASGMDDIDVLARAYTALHPGLYRYSTPDEIAQRFDLLKRDFGAAQSLADRYLVLSRFLATIRCGHTYANFFNQKDAVQKALFAGRDKLPFHFRWLGERCVVTKDFSNSGLPPGTEILSIAGQQCAKIIAVLLTVARADGHNDAKRRSLMSVQGRDRIESFDVYFPLLFGRRDAYEVEVREPGGRERRLTVAAIDLDQRRADSASVTAKSDDAPLWTFDTHGRTAVLTMPDWAVFDSKWDWKSWLNARLDVLAKANMTGLVIDLRDNEGGLDCGDEIVARLIDAKLPRTAMQRLVRYRSVPDDLRPYLDTWDKSFFDWGADAQPHDARFFTLSPRGQAGDGAILPKGPRFTGKVAVLVGPENSSATFQFAQLIQSAKLGTLLGEETGGNLRGINGGAFFFLRLPQSGLEADLPLIGTFAPEGTPDRGLTPDIAVPMTIDAIAAGKDNAMDRALSLVA